MLRMFSQRRIRFCVSALAGSVILVVVLNSILVVSVAGVTQLL